MFIFIILKNNIKYNHGSDIIQIRCKRRNKIMKNEIKEELKKDIKNEISLKKVKEEIKLIKNDIKEELKKDIKKLKQEIKGKDYILNSLYI